MTKKDKSKNKKKLNSQKHKKQIIKDLNKKKELHQKQQKERYAVQNGSKVITHNKTDLRNAPTYKAEKVKKGGFQPTFPITGGNEGFFDTRQKANEILSREMQKLNWQNVMLNEVQKRNMNPEQMQEYAEKNKELFDMQAQYDYTKKLVNTQKEFLELEQKITDLAVQNGLDPFKVRSDADAHVLYNIYEKGAKWSKKNVNRLENMIAMKEEEEKNKEISKKYMEELKIRKEDDIASLDMNLRLKSEEIQGRLKTLEKMYRETKKLEDKKRELIECNIEMNARQGRLFKDLSGLDVHGVPVNEKDFEHPEIAAKLAQLKVGDGDGGDLAVIETKIQRNNEMIKEMISGSLDKIKEHEKVLIPLVQEYNKTMAKGKELQPAMVEWLKKTKLVDNRVIKKLENPGPKQFLNTTMKFREVLEQSQKFNEAAFNRGFELLKNAQEIYMSRPYLRALINISGNQVSRMKLFTTAIEEFQRKAGTFKGFSPSFFSPEAEQILQEETEALKNGEETVPFEGPIVDFPYPLDRKIVRVQEYKDLIDNTGLYDFEDPESIQYMQNFFAEYGLLDPNVDYANGWNLMSEKDHEKLRDLEDKALYKIKHENQEE